MRFERRGDNHFSAKDGNALIAAGIHPNISAEEKEEDEVQADMEFIEAYEQDLELAKRVYGGNVTEGFLLGTPDSFDLAIQYDIAHPPRGGGNPPLGPYPNPFYRDSVDHKRYEKCKKRVAIIRAERHRKKIESNYRSCFESWTLGKNQLLNDKRITPWSYESLGDRFPRVVNFAMQLVESTRKVHNYLFGLYMRGPKSEREIEIYFKYLVYPVNEALRKLQVLNGNDYLKLEDLHAGQNGRLETNFKALPKFHYRIIDSEKNQQYKTYKEYWPAELVFLGRGRVKDTKLPFSLDPHINKYMRPGVINAVSYREWVNGDYSSLSPDVRELWEFTNDRMIGRPDRERRPGHADDLFLQESAAADTQALPDLSLVHYPARPMIDRVPEKNRERSEVCRPLVGKQRKREDYPPPNMANPAIAAAPGTPRGSHVHHRIPDHSPVGSEIMGEPNEIWEVESDEEDMDIFNILQGAAAHRREGRRERIRSRQASNLDDVPVSSGSDDEDEEGSDDSDYTYEYVSTSGSDDGGDDDDGSDELRRPSRTSETDLGRRFGQPRTGNEDDLRPRIDESDLQRRLNAVRGGAAADRAPDIGHIDMEDIQDMEGSTFSQLTGSQRDKVERIVHGTQSTAAATGVPDKADLHRQINEVRAKERKELMSILNRPDILAKARERGMVLGLPVESEGGVSEEMIAKLSDQDRRKLLRQMRENSEVSSNTASLVLTSEQREELARQNRKDLRKEAGISSDHPASSGDDEASATGSELGKQEQSYDASHTAIRRAGADADNQAKHREELQNALNRVRNLINQLGGVSNAEARKRIDAELRKAEADYKAIQVPAEITQQYNDRYTDLKSKLADMRELLQKTPENSAERAELAMRISDLNKDAHMYQQWKQGHISWLELQEHLDNRRASTATTGAAASIDSLPTVPLSAPAHLQPAKKPPPQQKKKPPPAVPAGGGSAIMPALSRDNQREEAQRRDQEAREELAKGVPKKYEEASDIIETASESELESRFEELGKGRTSRKLKLQQVREDLLSQGVPKGYNEKSEHYISEEEEETLSRIEEFVKKRVDTTELSKQKEQFKEMIEKDIPKVYDPLALEDEYEDVVVDLDEETSANLQKFMENTRASNPELSKELAAAEEAFIAVEAARQARKAQEAAKAAEEKAKRIQATIAAEQTQAQRKSMAAALGNLQQQVKNVMTRAKELKTVSAADKLAPAVQKAGPAVQKTEMTDAMRIQVAKEQSNAKRRMRDAKNRREKKAANEAAAKAALEGTVPGRVSTRASSSQEKAAPAIPTTAPPMTTKKAQREEAARQRRLAREAAKAQKVKEREEARAQKAKQREEEKAKKAAEREAEKEKTTAEKAKKNEEKIARRDLRERTEITNKVVSALPPNNPLVQVHDAENDEELNKLTEETVLPVTGDDILDFHVLQGEDVTEEVLKDSIFVNMISAAREKAGGLMPSKAVLTEMAAEAAKLAAEYAKEGLAQGSKAARTVAVAAITKGARLSLAAIRDYVGPGMLKGMQLAKEKGVPLMVNQVLPAMWSLTKVAARGALSLAQWMYAQRQAMAHMEGSIEIEATDYDAYEDEEEDEAETAAPSSRSRSSGGYGFGIRIPRIGTRTRAPKTISTTRRRNEFEIMQDEASSRGSFHGRNEDVYQPRARRSGAPRPESDRQYWNS